MHNHKETIRIHTLGNNHLFGYVIANHFGVNPKMRKAELCKLLRNKKALLIIGNLFEEWDAYRGEGLELINHRAIDIGLYHLRLLLKYRVCLKLEDTDCINSDLEILKDVSYPLYEKMFNFISK